MFGVALAESWENMPPHADVATRLQEWGIWDPGLTKEQAQHRYARFDGVEFGVAPPEAWAKLRQDLLEFEPHLASHQHAVGLVQDFPFTLKPKRGGTVHQKPTPLPPDKRKWVQREF
jgi:hypothetical protein